MYQEAMAAATGAMPSFRHGALLLCQTFFVTMRGLALSCDCRLSWEPYACVSQRGRTLLVYSKSAGHFWYFDSMCNSSSVPAHAQAIATKLAPVVSDGSGSSSSSVDVRVRSTPRQANGFDCGMYVLAIAEWLCASTDVAVTGGGRESEGTAALIELSTVDALTPAAITAKRAAISAVIRSLCRHGER
jgi:hypothetical protein